MTIKLKLAASFAVVLALLIGTALYGIVSFTSLNDTLQAMLNGPTARQRMVKDLNTDRAEILKDEQFVVIVDLSKMFGRDEVAEIAPTALAA